MKPRISVVTCSFNQGRFIGRTIDSVLAQDYPNLEHIIVDNVSTDETPQVLARYSHLRVIREPDSGQADAINKGFRHATGDIFCFLNSDDTFLPGALHRVAAEIDPARSRHIVVGRCLYTDAEGRPTGMEQPSNFVSHERVLAVWKGHHIPQPATFWTAEVWRRCGPMNEREHLVLDYDLMCRFSQHYDFHVIDQVLATWRLHTQSKSCSTTRQEIYERAVRVSKRYWGSPLTLRYWRLFWSLAEHRLMQAALLAPEVAARRALSHLELLFRRGGPVDPWEERRRRSPTTLAWRTFTDAYPDGSIGPVFTTTLHVGAGHTALQIDGDPVFPGLGRTLDLDVILGGRLLQRYRLPAGRTFSLDVPVTGFTPGDYPLTLSTNGFLVSDDYLGNNDFRPLTFRLQRLVLATEATARTPQGPAVPRYTDFATDRNESASLARASGSS
jgi:glycosyltransferase involved in cell wall biosynthesis